MEIKKAVVTVPYKGWHIQKLLDELAPAEVVQADHKDDAAVLKALEGADIAIINGDLDARFLGAPSLKWVHCDHAGLNQSARKQVFDRGLRISGSAGRSAPAQTEHVFFFALSLVYRTHKLYEAQKQHRWYMDDDYGTIRGLNGKTMGIIGLGNTGSTVAQRAKDFQMRVLAYTRRDVEKTDTVDELYSMDRGDTIAPLLEQSDFLVLCCRLSDETYHLMNRETFAQMKPSAFLINMSRGPVVDQDALLEALRAGTIAGAGCDVFDQEPLPASSPLWDAPNLIITPHNTPKMPDMTARALEIICENIRRYRAGEKLVNELVPRDLFSH